MQSLLSQKNRIQECLFLCNIYSIRAFFFEKNKIIKKTARKVIAFFSSI